MIYALQNDQDHQKHAIKKIFRKKQKSKDDINKIVEYVLRNGGVEYSVQKMEQLKNEALQILDTFPDSDAKASLIKLADYVINRNK